MILATEPKFFVVFAVRCASEDFEVEGVFTKEDDARALVDDILASDLFVSGSDCIQHLPFKAIVEILTSQRISALATVLREQIGEDAVPNN